MRTGHDPALSMLRIRHFLVRGPRENTVRDELFPDLKRPDQNVVLISLSASTMTAFHFSCYQTPVESYTHLDIYLTTIYNDLQLRSTRHRPACEHVASAVRQGASR